MEFMNDPPCTVPMMALLAGALTRACEDVVSAHIGGSPSQKRLRQDERCFKFAFGCINFGLWILYIGLWSIHILYIVHGYIIDN